jgi:hypothetical protein
MVHNTRSYSVSGIQPKQNKNSVAFSPQANYTN